MLRRNFNEIIERLIALEKGQKKMATDIVQQILDSQAAEKAAITDATNRVLAAIADAKQQSTDPRLIQVLQNIQDETTGIQQIASPQPTTTPPTS